MIDLSTITTITALAGSLAYLLAALSALRTMKSKSEINQSLPIWGLVGASLHLANIVSVAIAYNGLSSSFFDALSITAFIVVAMTLIAQLRHSVIALLFLVFVVASFCIALTAFLPHHSPITAPSAGILTHILSSIVAYSLLSLATAQAIILQLVERSLKHHEVSNWWRHLPPLQAMETLLFQLIGLGWLALTAAIISGGIYVDDLFAQHLAHKTVFSLISWILFGLLLFGRRQYGWRGSTAVRWTLAAFTALLLGYFGSKFVLEIILHRA